MILGTYIYSAFLFARNPGQRSEVHKTLIIKGI